jgi:hypothetical protein
MYYCKFADIITDADICEIQLPFKADRRIITPGAFSSEISITNEKIGSLVSKIIPGKTIVHVYRGSTIIGSYVIWAMQYSGQNSQVKCSIQGSTLESMLYRRRLHDDIYAVAVEQLDIADTLVSAAQAAISPYTVNSDLSIVTNYSPSGILRDRTYYASDGKFIGDLLEELANVDAGFEYIIHTYQDTSSRPRVMTFGYDKLNNSASTFVVEEPGNVTSWKILYDATKGGTVFWARGQTTTGTVGQDTQPTISSPAFATAYLDTGWPVIEMISDYQNASVKDTLDKYAAWWATNRSGPVIIPSFTVNPTAFFDHGFSPLQLGCMVNVSLANPAFPLSSSGSPSYSNVSRMIGFEITVDENGSDSMSIIVETEFDPTDVG